MDYCPWGHKEVDLTAVTNTFTFLLLRKWPTMEESIDLLTQIENASPVLGPRSASKRVIKEK